MILRFQGNKDAYGQVIFGRTIGLLRNGMAIDTRGFAICKYMRIEVDGGPKNDIQEIEFYKGEDDASCNE